MVEKNILNQALSIKDELISIYRELHVRPELSFKEFKTLQYIKKYLEKLGLVVKNEAGRTGVTAVLNGNLPGNIIALRADVDALPVHEETGLNYKSRNKGIMHACGHDAHTTILLGAAKLLCVNRDILRGAVKFIFQPAEEIALGAKAMVEEGVLKDPDVDMALSLHVMSHIKSGNIQVKEGIFLSAQDEFEIDILGKGGHGANPQNTIDPIITAAQLINTLQTVVSRKIDPVCPAVLSVCQFISGTKPNVIPDKAYLSGTIRSQDKNVRDTILNQLEAIIKGVCLSFGADYKLKITTQLSFTVNDKDIVKDFIEISQNIVDKSNIEISEKPYMYGEDFSYIAQVVPSMMFFLGTYNEKKGCIHGMHSSRFMVDEDILPLGAALITNYCLERKII